MIKSKTEVKDSTVIKQKRKKRRRIVFGSILILIIAVRIYLPYLIKDRLVKAINEVEGYECTIGDIDLAIFRGAFVIQEFEIKITENKVTKPFVAIKDADISIEWGAIFHGAIVGEIYLVEPELYFADGKSEEEDQAGGTSWVQPILGFIPLKINRFEIVNGKIEFENITSNPKVNLQLTNLSLLVTNLTNAESSEDILPSDLTLSGQIFGKGAINVDGKLNILKELPNMDLDLNIRHVDLKEMNSFTTAYANFDFEKGNLDVAVEFAMDDGLIKGYVKPLMTDVKIFDRKEEGSFLNLAWQGLVGFATELTKNQWKDQTATKIPISGRYDNPDIGVFEAVVNIFKNAFVKAYEPKTDGTIQFKDVKLFNKDNKGKKSKKKKK